ncbi:MAG TPA: hypothetical protein V6C72_02560 [Chroococcales cyanobacterium]
MNDLLNKPIIQLFSFGNVLVLATTGVLCEQIEASHFFFSVQDLEIKPIPGKQYRDGDDYIN